MTDIHAIDWNLCLERSNHNQQQAQELLAMLIQDFSNYQTLLEKAYSSDDKIMLSLHLKKLHDACCYTGVPYLQQHVEAAQTQLEQEQLPSQACINTILHQMTDIRAEARQMHIETLV